MILLRHSGTSQEWGLGAWVDHEDCLQEEKWEWEPASADAHDDTRKEVLLHARAEDWPWSACWVKRSPQAGDKAGRCGVDEHPEEEDCVEDEEVDGHQNLDLAASLSSPVSPERGGGEFCYDSLQTVAQREVGLVNALGGKDDEEGEAEGTGQVAEVSE